MYYRNQVINYLQENKILASKLEHALTGISKMVSDQIEMIGNGAQRAIYYTSCFSEEYLDVCQQQKIEDTRFKNAVIHLIQHGYIITDMIKIYFEHIFKNKTPRQLENIKQMLMMANVHIAVNSLTSAGFALAVAAAVAIGMNLSLNICALAGSRAAGIVAGVGIYGIVQKAAESAKHLQYDCPNYYYALYFQQLEMLYFIVEPLFEGSGAIWLPESDSDIVDIITKMV